MRFIKFLFFITLSAAFAAFAVINRESVALDLFPLPYSLDMPLFLLALICVGFGALAAGVATFYSMLHYKRELRGARRRIMALENEIGGMQAEKSITQVASHARR